MASDSLLMTSDDIPHQVPNTSPLFNMQILFELRATHQQGARHDDLRDEVFAFMFARVGVDPLHEQRRR